MLESREVVFTRRVHFLGRNGTGFCTGITVYYYPDVHFRRENFIEIRPITSQGRPGRCAVEVPLESIDELIDILGRLRDDATAPRESRSESAP